MSDVIRFPHLIETTSQTAPALSEDIKMSDLYAAPAKTIGADSRTAAIDTVSDFIPRHSPLPETVTGWRNQELADLYRTQRILALAGITTKVDRGLTDEGDPWFVFMDSLNEVFVHFSRIDGRYLVTSLMQEKPVWGDSLHDLVSEFSKQVQPVAQTPGAGRNVVSIAGRSRNAVLIHPAAALAALVWSIYLMSDDLVAATPMVTADAPDAAAEAPTADLAGNLADNLANDLHILPEVSQKALQVLSDPEFTKQVADPYAGRDNSGAALQMAALSTGISMKAVGLSLSLVALSVGLPLLETSEDAESDTAQNQLSIAQLYTLITRAKEAALSVLIATQDEQQQHASQTEHLIDDIRAQNAVDPTDDTQNIETSAEFAELVHSIATSYETEIQTILALKQAAAARQPQQAETDAAASADNTAGPEAAAVPAQTVSTLKPVQDTSLADNSFLLRFDTAFESFTLTSLDVIAQTELAELMTVNTTTADIIAPLTTPHVATNKFDAFDQEARMFLDFLLRTYSDIKVVSLPTEIIFIHVDAFELADVDHPIYAKSWSFDDGGVISTIGLKSDMAQFDLIA